jgi:protein-S-isoprenylcysteine O-methyltransferase Ste14
MLYVVPIYVLYVRAEESMMREEFGDMYDSYCKRVGGFLPRLRLSPNADKREAGK